MKPGIDLQALASKIETNRGLKKDFIADTSMTTVQVIERKPMIELPDIGQFPIQPIAHRQIATHTGVPAAYYDRMANEAPDLLATNINAWFRLHPARRMVRTLSGHARSFNSNRYQRIEHEEIAEVAFPILAELPNVKIVSCEITDARLYIHFVVPGIQGEVRVGDVVQAGGIISNSEVGLGSVSVAGLLWRLACLNGARTNETFRRNHVGRAVDTNEDLWADDTRQSDDRTVLLKVRDMVRAVVDEARFKANIAKLQGLADPLHRITGDPVKAVEVLAAKVGASVGEKDGILRSLIEGHDLTAWGLLNAVTAQSHNVESYDRAVELEGIGGSLIELPRAEWRQVLEAA